MSNEDLRFELSDSEIDELLTIENKRHAIDKILDMTSNDFCEKNLKGERQYTFFEHGSVFYFLEKIKDKTSKIQQLEYEFYYIAYILRRPIVPGCNVFDKKIMGTFFFIELMEEVSPALLKVLKSQQYNGDSALKIMLNHCSEAEVFAEKLYKEIIGEGCFDPEAEFDVACKTIKDYEMTTDINSISIKNIAIKTIEDKIGSIQWEKIKNSTEIVQIIHEIEEAYHEQIKKTELNTDKLNEIIDSLLSKVTVTTDERHFVAMLNSNATNQLSTLSNRNKPNIDKITGTATFSKGDLKVFIEKYDKLSSKLKISTHKLLDMCVIDLTKKNDYRGSGDAKTTVIFPLEKYMKLCNIPLTKPSKDKTRRKVKEDLNILFNLFMAWTEGKGKTAKDFAKMRLCDGVAIKNGNIVINFTTAMTQYLTHTYVMQYPKALLQVDERNPNTYHIGRKLLQHYSIDNNQRKGTAGILSVRSLLDVCENIPTYEEVMNSDRHVDKRIKTPIETALNSLGLITWEYCNAKGVVLTDNQLSSITYENFINLYINFTVKDFPNPTARIESNIKKRADRKKKENHKLQ